MKEMKICRKIEDFDGMQNGFGLKLEVRGDNIKVILISVDDLLISFSNDTYDFDYTIDYLKSMGFKFEWKPKLSLKEVLKKYETKPFEVGEENYFLEYNHNENIYECRICFRREQVGSFCFNKENINKILGELNG